jgi:signal transduction histidine kinase
LINVLNNAVDALEQEGRIAVVTRISEAPERQQPGIVIEITDTGAGIPPELLPKVFDLFMTTKTHDRGTGLGLAVSQEIVKEHGGKIEVSSQVQEGTSVKIFLPTGEVSGRSVSSGEKS